MALSAVLSLQVLMAAVFDLLFSQCDRHGQNLYLKPDGSLVLIDNDQVSEMGSERTE
jgi:predicted unusual protein kinase regulating ubiquinone biosynthesis (AarF/ABC1/UbiB family)